MDLVQDTSVTSALRMIREMNTWKRDEILSWQNKRLQELIGHFHAHCPYYRHLMEQSRVSPSDIESVNDLVKLPVITKEVLREHYNDIVPDNVHEYSYQKASTGGSTGEPLKFLIDNRSWSYTTAAKIYNWQTTSYRYGDSYASIGSSSLFPTNKRSWKHELYYFLRNGTPLNGMNLSDEVLANYVDLIRKKKIRYLYGYASSLYLLAKYVKKDGIELPIKGCFPTSEILPDNYRKTIEEAFDCFVMDTYGARDGGINAYEVESGCYYVGYNSYAEVDDFDSNTGPLIVTDLLNYAFPFIRYSVGDEVEFATKNNSSYNGQVFKRILGRETTIIRLDNGRVLTGPGFTILFKNLNVVAYRTIQTSGLSLKVEVQKGEGYTEQDENTILTTYKKHAGDECSIDLQYVDQFLPSSSGKRLFFVN